MTTLRKKYHDLGNKINTALMYIGAVKDQVEMYGGSEEDKKYFGNTIKKCLVAENVLLELDQELSAIKAVAYSLTDPDKDLKELALEAKARNQDVKLLVIDNDRGLCTIIKEKYEGRGFKVETAIDADSGKRMLLSWVPDILLLDLYLNVGMEGVDILRFIRSEKLPVKCAIITGETDEDKLKDVRALQPDEMLIKPVMAAQLTAKINAMVSSLRRK
ncbi:MAG: response regulator [Candidatus Omnitrophica bacterium]|nr:response regulator [Candidatus Omnitrophota bacterium]